MSDSTKLTQSRKDLRKLSEAGNLKHVVAVYVDKIGK